MDNWKIKDMIRSGYITYNVGDVVRIWKRKRNGYPHIHSAKIAINNFIKK
jgi:hypothetical protein